MSRLVVIVFLSLFASAAVAEEQLPPPQQHGAEKKDQYEKSMEERFRRLGKSLDELHARAAVMAEQARRETERSLTDAEQKRKEAGRKLQEMRTEGKKQWTRFVEEMNAAMDEFETACKRAKAHFKE